MNINSEELVVGSVTAAPQRLTGLDRLCLQGWLPRILIWNCQLDIKLLISSLKKAIDLYPYVAGRLCSQLDTHDFIIANNKGVKFTVDSYNKKIPIDISKETIDIYQYDDVDELAHQVDPESVDEKTPLLQIKLSIFNNGCVLGTTVNHGLMDGMARFNFMSAWSDFANSEIPPAPDLDRWHLQERANRDDITVETDYYLSEDKQLPSETKCNYDILKMDIFFINKLIEGVKKHQLKNEFISKQDVIHAYLWSLIVDDESSKDSETTTFTLIYDFRKRCDLSTYYFSNAYEVLNITKPVEKISNASIYEIARYIRSTINSLSQEKILSNLCFLGSNEAYGKNEMMRRKDVEINQSGCLFVANDTKFHYCNIDFGSETPIYSSRLLPSKYRFKSPYICINECPSFDGSVICEIALPEKKMQHVKCSWMQ